MNPWDLSCRPKLPSAYSPPRPQSLASGCGSSSSSQSSSPASSRSNSIGASDEIQISNCGLLLAQSATTMVANRQQSDTNTSIIAPSPRTSQDTNPSADRKARKKDQNRRAAYNYRRKKMDEKNRMREEEMRLVYSRVCLIGYADELESSIMCILNSGTNKILDERGRAMSYLCPVRVMRVFNFRDR